MTSAGADGVALREWMAPNHGVRHLRAPALPANPRRRPAFKLATVWLLAVGLLLAARAVTPAVAVAAPLPAVCATLTLTKFCLPSALLSLWERRDPRRHATG